MTREEAIKYLKIDINLSNRRTYVDSELILTNEEFKEMNKFLEIYILLRLNYD